MKIFDGHNDILNKITASADPMDTRAFLVEGSGQMDFTRALQGGFCGGFFAVYPSNPPEVPTAEERLVQGEDGYHVPLAPALPYDYAHNAAQGMIKLLKKIESDSLGQLRIVTEISEIQECLKQNIMSAILHLEGAEPVHPDLSNLEYFYEEGMRSLGITWSRPNAFGHGVPFEYPGHPDIGPGLTDAGKKLVKACNELGILIDLAHLNEKGFWDVVNLSDAPLVSTHTAAHNLVPKARNLTDEQLQAIQKSNGVVGVIFSVNDLDGEKRPKEDAPISAIITHIQYIADLIGVDHVAFGSDFDGTKIPSELGDISNFQLLVDLLEEAGFSHLEQEKICRNNWFRVLEKTWKIIKFECSSQQPGVFINDLVA